MFSRSLLITVVCFVVAVPVLSQAVQVDTLKTDTVIRKPVPRTGIRSFEEIISKNYSSKAGLFTVHQFRDTIYFEIPESLLKRDIEVINRLEKGPGGTGVYSGEQLDEKTIRFEWHAEDSSIRIRYSYVVSSADPESDIYKSVSKSNLDPVVMSFPVKAFGKDEQSYIIDASKWLKDCRDLS